MSVKILYSANVLRIVNTAPVHTLEEVEIFNDVLQWIVNPLAHPLRRPVPLELFSHLEELRRAVREKCISEYAISIIKEQIEYLQIIPLQDRKVLIARTLEREKLDPPIDVPYQSERERVLGHDDLSLPSLDAKQSKEKEVPKPENRIKFLPPLSASYDQKYRSRKVSHQRTVKADDALDPPRNRTDQLPQVGRFSFIREGQGVLLSSRVERRAALPKIKA